MKSRIAPALVGVVLATGCAPEFDEAEATEDVDAVVRFDDLAFDPDRLELPAGETVTLRLINVGGIVHDLVFEDGWASGHVDPGSSVEVELGPFDASTIGWCSIPGHRDAGMELEVVVASALD